MSRKADAAFGSSLRSQKYVVFDDTMTLNHACVASLAEGESGDVAEEDFETEMLAYQEPETVRINQFWTGVYDL